MKDIQNPDFLSGFLFFVDKNDRNWYNKNIDKNSFCNLIMKICGLSKRKRSTALNQLSGFGEIVFWQLKGFMVYDVRQLFADGKSIGNPLYGRG